MERGCRRGRRDRDRSRSPRGMAAQIPWASTKPPFVEQRWWERASWKELAMGPCAFGQARGPWQPGIQFVSLPPPLMCLT
eukprot:1824357-Alexandrium_andersonii.AAC.1